MTISSTERALAAGALALAVTITHRAPTAGDAGTDAASTPAAHRMRDGRASLAAARSVLVPVVRDDDPDPGDDGGDDGGGDEEAG